MTNAHVCLSSDFWNREWHLTGVVGACLGLLLCGGCDLLVNEEPFDVPPERLVSMTAVFEETHESGRPVHRLVVADVENPSNYLVLSEAGTDVGRSCFGPEKRRLLFEDNSETNVGSRAPIKLLDLETWEVRDLGATGTLKGCVWRADGSGFYYAAGGPAGLRFATFYNLDTGEKEPFAQSETQNGAMRGTIPYGRKGRDSILVRADSLIRRENGGFKNVGGGFYFVDAETSKYLTKVENKHFRIVPWEDPDRGGNRYSVFTPAYDDERDWIVFRRNAAAQESFSKIAVTNLKGSFFKLFGSGGFPKWGPEGKILFTRGGRAMILDVSTDESRELVAPEKIDGAMGLLAPDY